MDLDLSNITNINIDIDVMINDLIDLLKEIYQDKLILTTL